MDVKITPSAEARRATIWTDAETTPTELGRALDSILVWPDFRPGVQVLEVTRSPAGPATVTRAMRSLGNRARRLGLRRWAIVAANSHENLPHRTWSGIAGVVIVKVAIFDSIVSAIDWLGQENDTVDASTPPPAAGEQTTARKTKFNSPSATGYHPSPFLPRPDDKDAAALK